MQEQAWLQSIADHPDDHHQQLIYADWLEEHGDPRGAFMRLEVEYRQLATDDPKRRKLERQKQAFLASGSIVPLQANCIEPPEDDAIELAVASLGVPLPRAEDRRARQTRTRWW